MIPRRVLIVDPAFVGDVVFDGPLARALLRRSPGLELGLVVRPPADAIARRMVGVSAVHVFDKRGADRGLEGLRRVARGLEGYELALIPHPSTRSAALAAMARIPARVGIRGLPRGLLYTRAVETARAHVGLRLDLLAGLGLDASEEPLDLAGTLAAPPPPEGRPRIALALGANWGTKRWPVERAAELVRGVEDATFVLVGSEGERPLGEALARAAPGARLELAMGGGLDALLDHLAGCHAIVGGDTGPVHAARAMGRPAVILFGPTPDAVHAFSARERALAVELPCRPCSPHGPERCPLEHHRCMRELEGARVRAALDAVLRAPAAR